MSKFLEHNKFTKVVAIVLMVTGAIGIASFVFLAVKYASQIGILDLGGLVFGLAVLGLVSGIFLWKQFEWPLKAAIIYFLLQLIAIRTPDFTFELYSGIYFFISISQGSSVIAFNVFALLMLILTIRGKNELANTAPNKSPQPTTNSDS